MEILNEDAMTWDRLSPAAKKLVIHADICGSMNPNNLNFTLKDLKKNFDEEEAEKLAKKVWRHHADRVAIDCHGKNCSGRSKWYEEFNKTDRDQAGKHWHEASKYRHDNHETAIPMGVHEGICDYNGFKVKREKEDDPQAYFKMVNAVLMGKPLQFNEAFEDLILAKLAVKLNEFKDEIRINYFGDEEITEAFDSRVPLDQIRHHVGDYHVSKPDTEVEADIRNAAGKRKGWTPELTNQAVKHALNCHHINQRLYKQVMHGFR
jgi:hypothetical protein